MFIMRIHHEHGCNLGIHLRRLRAFGEVLESCMWVSASADVDCARASLGSRHGLVDPHQCCARRGDSAEWCGGVENNLPLPSKVRLGRHFSLNFHISRRYTDHVVNGFRSRNDAKNQGSIVRPGERLIRRPFRHPPRLNCPRPVAYRLQKPCGTHRLAVSLPHQVSW